MGARLYDPTLGRFLSKDPVSGGSANNYEYCFGDPVNCFDLTGTLSLRGLLNAIATTAVILGAVASIAAIAAGCIVCGWVGFGALGVILVADAGIISVDCPGAFCGQAKRTLGADLVTGVAGGAAKGFVLPLLGERAGNIANAIVDVGDTLTQLFVQWTQRRGEDRQ